MIEILGNFESNIGKDVLKNLKSLYSTRAGEVALDREFGLNQDFVDEPWPQAQSMLTSEIISKTKRYEKRAQVLSVEFKGDSSIDEFKTEVNIDVSDS